MSIVDSLRNSIETEITICKHLYTKFDANDAAWRPRENMRSVLHLLQYLCYIGTAVTEHFVDPIDDAEAARAKYRAHSKWSGEAVTFENFPEMIEQEKQEIFRMLA